MNLRELVDTSGDSHLIEFRFNNSILEVRIFHDEFDNEVIFKIRTNTVFGADLSEQDDIASTCRIEFSSVKGLLSEENGYFVAAKQFSMMMKETKLHLNLAYGVKAVEKVYLFSLVGYSRILSCLVLNGEKDIFWQFVNPPEKCSL